MLKCVFTSTATPCLVCRKEGISLCVKRWGPAKETEEEGRNSTEAQLTGSQVVVQPFNPEPSRQIPTAIDAVINGKEINMLQYVYLLDEQRPNEGVAEISTQIFKRISLVYGLSIECLPLRSALLALSGALQFNHGGWESEQQLDEYSSRACRALRDKSSSSFDLEEFFTIYFLIFAESERLWTYAAQKRTNSDTSIAHMQMRVHVRGILTMMKDSWDRLRTVCKDRFGEETWANAQEVLAGIVAIVGGPEQAQMAFLYRKHLSEVKDHPMMASNVATRLTAVGNIIAGLSKTILERLVAEDEGDVVLEFTRHELKRYLLYADKSGLFSSSTATSWHDILFWTLQKNAAKVILYLSTESSKQNTPQLFVWANELISTALCLYKNPRPVFAMDDRTTAITYITAAALVIPPPEEFDCISSHSRLSS